MDADRGACHIFCCFRRRTGSQKLVVEVSRPWAAALVAAALAATAAI